MSCPHVSVCIVTATLLVGGMALTAEPNTASQETEESTVEASDQDADRSVTVFPIGVGDRSPDMRSRIAEVVGMLLERAGIENVGLSEAPFTRPDTDDPARIAAAFGKYVREASIATEYALYGEYIGTPQTGAREIRTILVDRQGKLILAESDNKRTYSKTSDLPPKDLMGCSVFIARRVQKLWGLPDPLRADAPTGKLHEQWGNKTGVPTKSEVAKIEKRLEVLKKNLKTSELTVYPIRIGTDKSANGELAVGLSQTLSEQKLCRAKVSTADPKLQIKGDPNEQKVLWDTARAFREFVRKNPPDTDYALYADYGMWVPKVHHVHFIVCDRTGDWVLVDYQNSHHADFQEIDPESAEDCNRLVVKRLRHRLAD